MSELSGSKGEMYVFAQKDKKRCGSCSKMIMETQL